MLNIDTVNWMSKLDSKLTLTDLSIPGTHDSGTYADPNKKVIVPIRYARCQDNDFKAQLEDGIRFFDIRIGLGEEKKLMIFHGKLCVFNISLTDILKVFKKFLDDHNGEIILISVKHETEREGFSKSVVEIFTETIKEFDNYFFKKSYMPTLGEARGKIVLFNRLDFFDFGFPWTIWNDNTIFSIIYDRRGVEFYIEDCYEGENQDTNKKLKKIYQTLEKAIDPQNRGIFYVTFCSIAAKPLLYSPSSYALGQDGVNPGINKKVYEYTNSYFESKRFGLVILDYYKKENNNSLVKSIIKSNPGSASLYGLPIPVDNIKKIELNKKYYIISKSSKKCIQMSKWQREEKSIADLCDIMYGENQQFIWNKTKDNLYYITSAANTMALEAEGPELKDRVVQMSKNINSKGQLWRIEDVQDDGWFKLENVKTHKYMDVCGDEKENGTTIITYKKKDVNNQLFKLYEVCKYS